MGVLRTLPALVASNTVITPVYSGTVIAASTFAWAAGIATVVLNTSAFPKNGYNGPNVAISNPPSGGQQVTLWGFTSTAGAYANGRPVTVIDNNPALKSFRFYLTGPSVTQAATSDAGSTAACPFQHYRAVRIEIDPSASDTIWVGDLNLSSTQYMAALSAAGQTSIEIASENIPADRIFVLASGDNADDIVHCTLIY